MEKSGSKISAKNVGKHIGKSSISSSSKTKPTTSKLPPITPSTSNKASIDSNNYSTKKKSTTFGVIWLPKPKGSKHKDYVYNAYKHNEREKERAPSMYNNIMSGDSSNNQTLSNNLEEGTIQEKTPVVLGGVATATALQDQNEQIESTEKSDYMKAITEEDREAAGDVDNQASDVMENEEKFKGSANDNVDSVFLRPPPADKARSTPSTQEEDSCGMKCLFYTLQCWDCVVM